MPPHRGSARSTATETTDNKPRKAQRVKKRAPKFAAVTVNRVINLEFTSQEKKWIRDHSEENFKAPIDATPLEKQDFCRLVWNKFVLAFPDRRLETSQEILKGGVFKHCVWGKQMIQVSRYERWFRSKGD